MEIKEIEPGYLLDKFNWEYMPFWLSDQNAVELKNLYLDIKENGQKEPVTVSEDYVVLDGKHRVVACAFLGRKVKYKIKKEFSILRR